jgi:hypothetical protein
VTAPVHRICSRTIGSVMTRWLGYSIFAIGTNLPFSTVSR